MVLGVPILQGILDDSESHNVLQDALQERTAAKTSLQQASRVARHDNRRLLTTYADLDLGELLRFNQLKVSNSA